MSSFNKSVSSILKHSFKINDNLIVATRIYQTEYLSSVNGIHLLWRYSSDTALPTTADIL
jgi:hypothetical protein